MRRKRLPDRPLILFDGDCGFCENTTRWIATRFSYAPPMIPYQRADLDTFGLTTNQAAAAMWLITDRQKFSGFEAIMAILRLQPERSLRFVGWLGTVPPWSWAGKLAYRMVKRFRYLLPGSTAISRTKMRP